MLQQKQSKNESINLDVKKESSFIAYLDEAPRTFRPGLLHTVPFPGLEGPVDSHDSTGMEGQKCRMLPKINATTKVRLFWLNFLLQASPSTEKIHQ
jgi:hypothetical protein